MTTETLLTSAAAIIVCSLLGYFGTLAIWPLKLPRQFVVVFAPGFGAALCSFIFFSFRRPMFTVESGLLVALLTYWCLVLRKRNAHAITAKPLDLALPAVCSAAFGASITGLLLRVDRVPHGSWDGWAIWNTHARFLYRDGDQWQYHIAYTFHGDYPLLIPSLTARLWRYVGYEFAEAGALMGLLFTFSALAVLIASLWRLRDPRIALLLGLTLLGTPAYLDYGAAQYADVPLSFFVLCTIALLCMDSIEKPRERGLLLLSGISAGCAGWTKNEGLLFIFAAVTALSLPVFVAPAVTIRRLLAFTAGLLLPAASILFFKLTIAPPNDLLTYYHDVMGNLLTADRHLVILNAFATTFWSFGAWAVPPMLALLAFMAFRGIDQQAGRDLGWRTGVAILSIVVVGYYLVYVLTPVPLEIHLSSSLDRLMIHLWPSSLLLIGLTLKTDNGG